jgi:5-methylcytosine-specific restriction enzyme A
MAREFAGKFYVSKQWRKLRDYVYERDLGLCVRCDMPGEIVHHKEHITQESIGDPFVTLNADNCELICRDCHAAQHKREKNYATSERLSFDDKGNIIIGRQVTDEQGSEADALHSGDSH